MCSVWSIVGSEPTTWSRGAHPSEYGKGATKGTRRSRSAATIGILVTRERESNHSSHPVNHHSHLTRQASNDGPSFCSVDKAWLLRIATVRPDNVPPEQLFDCMSAMSKSNALACTYNTHTTPPFSISPFRHCRQSMHPGTQSGEASCSRMTFGAIPGERATGCAIALPTVGVESKNPIPNERRGDSCLSEPWWITENTTMGLRRCN